MPFTAPDPDPWQQEYRTLMRAYGEAQLRCSDLLRAQGDEIQRLQAERMRLRAAVVRHETEIAWAREDRDAIDAATPGLPRRRTLARRVEALLARIRELLRDQLRLQPDPLAELPPVAVPTEAERAVDLRTLETSLAAADLVICQTGCLSHGAYWKVQDHCRRTGKACVLVEQPGALRIVRIADSTRQPGDAAD